MHNHLPQLDIDAKPATYKPRFLWDTRSALTNPLIATRLLCRSSSYSGDV